MSSKSNKNFALLQGYSTVGELKNSSRKIAKILADYNDTDGIQDVDFDGLNTIIYSSEKAALSCRKYFEMRAEKIKKTDENLEALADYFMIEHDSLDDVCHIEFAESTLKILTPLTLKRGHQSKHEKENYMMMNYISAALTAWQREKGIRLFKSMSPPFVLVIKRIAGKKASVADNDNIETGRIVNEIMNAVGWSDNANNVDVYSCVERTSEKEAFGTEFILMSADQFISYLAAYKNATK